MSPPAILLFGRDGQLGRELARCLGTLGTVTALGRAQADLARPDAIRDVIRRLRPALIVNAAAYNAVDRAEQEEELATAINGVAPGVMAEEARALGAALVHYSTDFVFGGPAPVSADGRPRPLVESDPPAPAGAYARSKRAGEEAVREAGCAHLVFRTSWVFSARGRTFLAALLRREFAAPELRIVADEFSAPTWAQALADATGQILAAAWAGGGTDALAARAGIYHLAGRGAASRCDFARAVLDTYAARGDPVPAIRPVASAEFPTPASRPAWSVLDSSLVHRTFGVGLPDWRISLALSLAG